MEIMNSPWNAILPHLLLSGGAVIVYLVGALRPQGQKSIFAITLGTLLLALALACASLPPHAADIAAGMVDSAAVSRYYTILVLLVSVATVLLLRNYARRQDLTREVLYGTLLLATLGMIGTAAASHWLIFFLSFELLSLSLYILVAIDRKQANSYEAGIKYFVMGAVASAFLVFGIGLLYATTGTLVISASLAALAETKASLPALPAVILILAGIGFKLSLVPFHLWTPDVYEGAPAPITAFLSTGSKLALFAALLRMVQAVPQMPPSLLPVLWLLAAATMLLGNLTALVQEKVKRMLAYSSIAHMGYMLMALLAGGDQGVTAVLFYSAVYALMDLGAFGGITLLSVNGQDSNHLRDFRGAGSRHPLASALLTVSLVSLAGLPPTAGFFGKFMLFTAAFKGGYPWLAAIGLLSALISIFYYQRVVVALYQEREGEAQTGMTADWAGALAASVILLLLCWFGLLPAGLLTVIQGVLTGN